MISSVQGIWNNERFYRGYYKYGKTGIWVKGEHEPILEPVEYAESVEDQEDDT